MSRKKTQPCYSKTPSLIPTVNKMISQVLVKFVSYSSGVIYAANQQYLYILKLPQKPTVGKLIDFESTHKITPGSQILGLFNVFLNNGGSSKSSSKSLRTVKSIMALETDDKQVDFLEIQLQNAGTANFSYKLLQQREVYAREISFDKIS